MGGTLAFVIAATGALAMAPAANAATLFSNIPGGAGGGGDETTQTIWHAQSFVPTTTGTARVASFWAVTYLTTPQVTASPVISIWTNDPANGGQPGAPMTTGAAATVDADTESAPTCTALSQEFGEHVELAAGQTYWAVMRSNSATKVLWLGGQGGDASKVSNNSGGSWAPRAGGAFSIRVDDNATCAPDINTNPTAGTELGDMYAKPGGTGFQTLFASNNGTQELSLTGGSFIGPNASMFKLFKGEPGGPEGSNFTFPKPLGTGTGGVILYTVCSPPPGTLDGVKTATFRLTSNDPDEGSLDWPVWCLVDSTPPSLEFIVNPDGREGWFVTRPAPIQIRGVDPASGNRVKHIFCTDNGAPTLDWPNGSFASFGIQPDGTHALSCQGTDAANNTSAPGAYTATVKVDGTPPETTKGEVGPPAVSGETAFDFSFTGSDAMSGFIGEFECRLDGGPYRGCSSAAGASGLSDGRHDFYVRARDVAGNYDPTPAQWTWEVDLPAGAGGSCTVPKVKRGASLRVAKRKLAAAGCTPGKVRRVKSGSVGRGKLIRLRSKPGTVLEPAVPVGIVLSKGR